MMESDNDAKAQRMKFSLISSSQSDEVERVLFEAVVISTVRETCTLESSL